MTRHQTNAGAVLLELASALPAFAEADKPKPAPSPPLEPSRRVGSIDVFLSSARLPAPCPAA